MNLEYDHLQNHTFVRMLSGLSKKQIMLAVSETQDLKLLSRHQGCLKSKEDTDTKQKEQASKVNGDCLKKRLRARFINSTSIS